MAQVSVIYGNDRRQNIYQALDLLKEGIRQKLIGKKNIVVKPNLCVADNDLAVTDVFAVKALLDYLINEFYVSQNIIIAEGPFDGGLDQCLKAYGYYEKLAGYPVKYVDLNQDQTEIFEIKYDGKAVKLNLAKTILASDFLISICPAKTHDAVITTLAIKNVAVGSIVVPRLPPKFGSYTRALIHGSPYKINKIISGVAKYVWPDLAIIDGSRAMAGNGPVGGEAVDFGLTFASLDPLAADSLCSQLMGFNPKAIGYYHYCRQMGLGTDDLGEIEVLGVKDVQKYQKWFKPHDSYQYQLDWQKDHKIKNIYKFGRQILEYGKKIIKKALKSVFNKLCG